MREPMVAVQIVERLGARRMMLARRMLSYVPMFCCPVCGGCGDARLDDTAAVLFLDETQPGDDADDALFAVAFAAAIGPLVEQGTLAQRGEYAVADMFADHWWPVQRWQVRRRHHGCASPPILPWSDVDTLVVSLPRSADAGPPDLLWPLVVDAGRQKVPLVVVQQQLPQVWANGGDENVAMVDRLLSVLDLCGAGRVTSNDLAFDDLAKLAPLRHWSYRLDDAAVVVAGKDDMPICRIEEQPTPWLQAVADAGQLMLIAVPPQTLDPGLDAARLLADECFRRSLRDSRALGGMIYMTGRVAPAPTTAPARQVPLIDVADLWQRAQTRAFWLAAEYERFQPLHRPSWDVDPVELLALVLTAQAREHDCTPHEVPLMVTADRLADHQGLRAYLDMLLAPTTVADRWAAARHPRNTAASWQGPEYALPVVCRAAARPVHRQRLVERGGLRLGDRVRLIDPPGSEHAEDKIGVLNDVLWHPRPGQGHTVRDTVESFVVRTDPRYTQLNAVNIPLSQGQDILADESSLLLCDDTDPRALPHALRCAVSDLASVGVEVTAGDPGWAMTVIEERGRALLVPRLAHYGQPARGILQRVVDPRVDFRRAVVEGLGKLHALGASTRRSHEVYDKLTAALRP